MPKQINKALKALIVGKYGSQVDGAEALKIKPTMLSHYIRRRREPSDEHLKRFRAAFGDEAVQQIFGAAK